MNHFFPFIQICTQHFTVMRQSCDILAVVGIKSSTKVQIEFAQIIDNPFAKASGGGNKLLQLMNEGDARFDNKPKQQRGWMNCERAMADKLFGIKCLNETDEHYVAQWTGEGAKPRTELFIADVHVNGEPINLEVTETVVPSEIQKKNKSWKTKGKGGEVVMHKGLPVYSTKTPMVGTPNHTFLEMDTVPVIPEVAPSNIGDLT